MSILKSYTISGLKALYRLPDLDVVQFTLNSRTWPGKRQTVRALQEISKCSKTDIFIHWDFIYIASRFAMFSADTRKAIINEVIDILRYAKDAKNIKGIVMHTDFSIRREIIKDPTVERISDAYNTSTWDLGSIINLTTDLQHFTENNIKYFYDCIKSQWGEEEFPIKIYLENTTKVSPDNQGSLSHLYTLILVNNWEDLFGICFDTEHYYAVDGEYQIFNTLDQIKDSGVDVITHLNTIPEGVKPKSGKDRHSDTTIFECSVKEPQWYINTMKEMISRGYTYIREVHEETMFRELEQIKEYAITSKP